MGSKHIKCSERGFNYMDKVIVFRICDNSDWQKATFTDLNELYKYLLTNISLKSNTEIIIRER